MKTERPPEERGSIRKDPGGKLGVALVYPNAYRLGMANLGFHAVYRLFNESPATLCERAFLPEDGGAPHTVESGRPLSAIQTLVAVVAVGLGALVAASGPVVGAVRWLGVAYLVYLGVQQWRAPVGPAAARAGQPEGESPRALFLRGYLVNVTNPKGIVFLLAVLPQFVDLARPAAPQYALCGASLAFTDLVVMSGYAIVARSLLRWYGSPSHLRWLNRVFGALFVGAGLGLALWRRG